MRRTNSFDVVPQSEQDEAVLRRLLDASASLWNQLTYERRQHFFAGESVWDSEHYYDEYVDVLGSATTQQITRVNDAAWRSFFETVEKADQEVSPPGYWGNQADGRDLRTYIRNDAYTISWGERSRLEVPIGSQLKDEYGFGRAERLRVVVRGEPHWQGDQGRLHLTYDDVDETYRAHQPVTVSDEGQATPTGSDVAALDIGANVLVACTTTAGDQYCYSGQEPFRQFRETTERIADAKAKLPGDQNTSKRIQRLYRKRSRRRDHAVNALLRDLVERLYDDGVETIYYGDLTGVLGEYWSVKANLKARTFWAHRQCLDQLTNVCEEYGIEVAATSEAWTSQTCPECGEREQTRRHRETLTCPCGFEGHADLVASRTLLEQSTNTAVRPTARPVRFQWDDHQWYPVDGDAVASNE
ncbi:RNA-guided endonuclease InsQ/TnpB family protein [Haloarcula sebkhae]|uniref:RNA-guided endonuclease InsQ/TnpB family protein n=2 Tax=Haloarcula sebkhae TaxID=932660 RepID=A0ACC6VRS7_9EURY|nr:RNA-guided endonuclease TnpB family protein [Haloarcula sebkhae]GGK79528.1 transposase [Haloarcula sebkhae]